MASDTSGEHASGEHASGRAARFSLFGVGSRVVLFWVATALVLVAVTLSVNQWVMEDVTVPRSMYVFAFLGAAVYTFTSLSEAFGDERYGYKLLSRTVAALPLAAGVYLLAFAFEATGAGDPSVGRMTAGLAFLSGLFVSTTLKALGSLAERLLGVNHGGSGDK